VSTANGVASNEDLRRVITNGLNGSGMPSFNSLSEQQVQSLVTVLGLLWKDRPTTVEPITVPPRPASTVAMVAEGKEHFGQYCASCHGAGGRGDGASADTIKDSFGNHIPPRNLVSDTIRGGSSPAQLYVRISAGVPDGKDHWLMPQFRELGPQTIWALVAYLEAEILPQRKAVDPSRTAAR
jgi:mono/diheme cytochrome c family protein